MSRRVIKPSKAGTPAVEPIFDPAQETENTIPAFLRKGITTVEPAAQQAQPAAPAKGKRTAKAATPAPAKRKRAVSPEFAALFEKAGEGILPPLPDLSAPTHKAFRAKLAAVVTMVEAGDLEGLKADSMEPKSSSRMKICRYRDLAITALISRAKQVA